MLLYALHKKYDSFEREVQKPAIALRCFTIQYNNCTHRSIFKKRLFPDEEAKSLVAEQVFIKWAPPVLVD